MSTPPSMPRGIKNFYLFDFFNTTSWTVVLGTPMLLFLQHLHATATIVAVTASLSPLLITLQIPAARHVERIGYRRFALNGFSARTFFLIGITVVAFLPDSFDRTTRIVLMIFLTFFYSAIRGITSCSLLPWVTHIVPEEQRGEFLAKDQAAVAFSGIVSLLFYALVLKGSVAWYSFGIVFATGTLAGFFSLTFMKRIPDVPVEKIANNPNPLPWREMFFYPPFLHYLRYNLVINLALGTSGVFWVRYFRAFLHVSNSNTLLIACLTNTVLTVTLLLIMPLLDRTGNKPVLIVSGLFLIAHFTGWACVAAGVLPFSYPVILLQIFTSGVGGALWNVGNIRAVMNIIPAMGRPHFLALYSVMSSLTVAIVPLLWGPVIDALDTWHAAWGFWNWNSYSVLYCALAVNIMAGMVMLRAVVEPVQMTWDVFVRELLILTPSRAVTRLIVRLRSFGTG